MVIIDISIDDKSGIETTTIDDGLKYRMYERDNGEWKRVHGFLFANIDNWYCEADIEEELELEYEYGLFVGKEK